MTYTLKFNAELEHRLEFDELNVYTEDDHLEKCVINARDGIVCLKLSIQGVDSEEEAHEIAKKELSKIIAKLSFFFVIRVSNYTLIVPEIKDVVKDRVIIHENGDREIYLHDCGVFIENVSVTKKPSDSEIKRLEDFLCDRDDQDLDGYMVFHSALNCGDIPSRYIQMYKILGQFLGNDTQKNIDNFIKRVEPRVRIIESIKDDKPIRETIYTNIRNRFVHHRQGSSSPLLKVIEDMNSHIVGLMLIVKKAIQNGP